MEELKAEYNKWLIRHNKGAVYLDSNVSLEQKERWASEFAKILRGMNELAAAIEKQGHKMTDKEITDGFGVITNEQT